jgi:hypothetical protein
MVSLPETLHEMVSFALWFGMGPDGSLIVARDLSRQENFRIGVADAMTGAQGVAQFEGSSLGRAPDRGIK